MRTDQALERFMEKVAIAKEAEGLPRIAGRIVGLFLLYPGPFSFSEIAERVNASRGSVSTNMRLVRDRGIVELISRPGDRQDYYQLANDPYRDSLEQSLVRLESLEKLARETAAALRDKDAGLHTRLMEMARVHALARVHVQALHEALYGP